MYGNTIKIPSAGRRPKRHQSQVTFSLAGTTALTHSLTRGLRQGLYNQLFQGYAAPNLPTTTTTSPRTLPSFTADSSAAMATPTSATTPVATLPAGPPIRQVSLMAGELVSAIFIPEEGLVSKPPDDGRLMVLTNQRLMAFGQHEGMKETALMPVEEVKAVAISFGARSKGTIIQGALMVGAAVILYVLLAYWLTGRIDGPTVPIIRMDLVAFIVFLAVLSGVGLLAQIYFSKPDGEVNFQGDGVKITFPFKGESAEADVFKVVNSVMSARQAMVAQVGIRNSGAGSFGINTDTERDSKYPREF